MLLFFFFILLPCMVNKRFSNIRPLVSDPYRVIDVGQLIIRPGRLARQQRDCPCSGVLVECKVRLTPRSSEANSTSQGPTVRRQLHPSSTARVDLIGSVSDAAHCWPPTVCSRTVHCPAGRVRARELEKFLNIRVSECILRFRRGRWH